MQLAKTIYQLKEAAEIANCRPSDILDAGSIGAISLLVGVPDGVILRLKANDRQGVTGEPALMRVPNLLVLRKEDCLAIKLKGKVLASEFPLGFSFAPQSGFRSLHPSDCDTELPVIGAHEVRGKDPRRRWVAWCVRGTNSTEHLKIVAKRVLVATSEIIRVYGIDLSTLGNVEGHDKSDLHKFVSHAAQEWPASHESLAAPMEPPSLITTADTNNNRNDKPPGKMPNTTIGKLAVREAWQIEMKLERKAAADEVIANLRQLVDKEDTLIETIPHGVKWMTKALKAKNYDIEACQKTLKTWNESRA